MLRNRFSKLMLALALFAAFFSVSAQKKSRQPNKTPVDTTAETALQPEPQKQTRAEAEPTPPPAGKKNSRPGGVSDSSETVFNKNAKFDSRQNKAEEKPSSFSYEFSQPQFIISHIRIEHDENGKGKITFKKKDFDEEYTDPVQLTETTLNKIKAHFEALNFLDSTENYQYEKDFSHLGAMKISRQKDGRARAAEFNWTANADAKAIADEYRKIANQYIWMFDITVARENQPLETPRIMKALDVYLRRGEISDPPQMIPFLKDLSDDERIPLIARNNAARIIKEIEKKKKD